MKVRSFRRFLYFVGIISCIITIISLVRGSLLQTFMTAHAQDNPEHNTSTSSLPSNANLPFAAESYVLSSCPPLDMPSGSWEVEAKPNKGFHWPYFYYLPKNINSTYALVVPNNSGQRSDDFCFHRQRALWSIHEFRFWADELRTPLIVPIFPRFDDETDGTIASQYLGRGTLEKYWQKRYPRLSRQDLQLIAMIDDAFSINTKVLLWGYSASAMFVSRFVILHPDRIRAAAFGGHGWAISPVADWDGLDLPYPYGAKDLLDLIGAPINFKEFRGVPLYVYMGAKDNNGWALPWYIGNGKSYDYKRFKQKFGTSASSLMTSAQTIFNSLNCSVIFKLYPGAKHQRTAKMDEDSYHFLNFYR